MPCYTGTHNIYFCGNIKCIYLDSILMIAPDKRGIDVFIISP